MEKNENKIYQIKESLKKQGFNGDDLILEYNEDGVQLRCRCMISGIGDWTKLKRHTDQTNHRKMCGWYLGKNHEVISCHKGTTDIRTFWTKQPRKRLQRDTPSAQPPFTKKAVNASDARKLLQMEEIDGGEATNIAKKILMDDDQNLTQAIMNAQVEHEVTKRVSMREKQQNSVLASLIMAPSSSYDETKVDAKKSAVECMRMSEGKDELHAIKFSHAVSTTTLNRQIATLEAQKIAASIMTSMRQEFYVDHETLTDFTKVLISKDTDLENIRDQASIYINAIFASEKAKVQEMKINFKRSLDPLNDSFDIGEEIRGLAKKLQVLSNDDDKSKLFVFLRDIIQNCGRKGRRWNDHTKTLFATIASYGGPRTADMLSTFLDGPSSKTISRVTKSARAIPTEIEEGTFHSARAFYNIFNYHGPFQLSVDATAVVPALRVRNNKIYGLACAGTIEVYTAEQIVELISKNHEKVKLANLLLLSPLLPSTPSFIISIQPAVKGEDFSTVELWFTTVRKYGLENNLKVIGFGADGDSKVRKFYEKQFSHNSKATNVLTFKGSSYDCVIEDINGQLLPKLPFPDWKHCLKKLRNQILNVKKLLVIGDYAVKLEHLMNIFEKHKLDSGLWKTDIYVRDKQNVDAAIRILKPEVRACLSANERTLATQVYLKIGEMLLKGYTSKDMSVEDRVLMAWLPVLFLRLWKSWLQISKLSVDTHFITQQTFIDVIIAGHTIILSLEAYSTHFKNTPYHPELFGSDACEKIFSKLRTFVRGQQNFTLLDMLDYSRRIQILEELKQSRQESFNKSIPSDISTEINRGLEAAQKEVLAICRKFNLVEALVQGNNLGRDPDGSLFLRNLDFAGWSDGWESECPPIDEDDVFDFEELEENVDLLQKALDVETGSLTADVTDALAEVFDEGESDMNTSTNDFDDDDPSQCAFFRSEKCLHSKLQRKSKWIGCQVCGLWYHQECVGLSFKSLAEEESYLFCCPSHGQEMKDVTYRVKASKEELDGAQFFQKEITTVEARRKICGSADVKRMSGSSYVKYDGFIYHIARFLSLQAGKAYCPSASRQERWRSTNTTCFFDKIGEVLVRNQNFHINNFCTYVPLVETDNDYVYGKVERITKKFGLKSTYAVLTYEEDKKSCYNVFVRQYECVDKTLKPLRKYDFVPLSSVLLKLSSLKITDEEDRKTRELRKKFVVPKQGSGSGITVKMLQSYLDSKNIKYKKSARKPELLKLAGHSNT
ncbi:uncharacterized protein [Clytia hemisphaerica]|uniref:uncharacterized protein n=1 Tax=Clytia hemisphaerica TaxID=252671 RepID=UPI0034D60AA5